MGRMDFASIYQTLLGVLYGDCLGASTEGHRKPVPEDKIVVGPSRYGHAAGRGTDDTETTLAVAHGLIDARANASNPTETIARRLLQWRESGPRDIGRATARGLESYAQTGNPLGGPRDDHAVANGSLMRSAPFVAYGRRGPQVAAESSCTTHAHPVVLDCVRAYVGVLVDLCQGHDVGESDIGWWPGQRIRQEIERVPCEGEGHAVYAANLAAWAALFADDFESGLRRVIRLGGDTDTNGAICGAVLGARFGFPPHLGEQLDAGRVREVGQVARALSGD